MPRSHSWCRHHRSAAADCSPSSIYELTLRCISASEESVWMLKQRETHFAPLPALPIYEEKWFTACCQPPLYVVFPKWLRRVQNIAFAAVSYLSLSSSLSECHVISHVTRKELPWQCLNTLLQYILLSEIVKTVSPGFSRINVCNFKPFWNAADNRHGAGPRESIVAFTATAPSFLCRKRPACLCIRIP